MKSRPKKSPHQAAFEEIYERHSREVWALVYARWLNADIALDIMQETFLRLWKQWQEGSDIVNPRAWVLRVARNSARHARTQCLNQMRSIISTAPEPIRAELRNLNVYRVGCHYSNGHAAMLYSWIKPPSRSRRRTRPGHGEGAGWSGTGSASGARSSRARWGRWA